MADAPMSEAELEQFVGVLRKRQSRVEHLVDIADKMCIQLESSHPVSLREVEVFRLAIDAVKTSRLLAS